MRAKAAVITATVYLMIYSALSAAGYNYPVVLAWYLGSPFIVLAMVYIVLKDNRRDYPELADGEEWGYRDKSKDELGVF